MRNQIYDVYMLKLLLSSAAHQSFVGPGSFKSARWPLPFRRKTWVDLDGNRRAKGPLQPPLAGKHRLHCTARSIENLGNTAICEDSHLGRSLAVGRTMSRRNVKHHHLRSVAPRAIKSCRYGGSQGAGRPGRQKEDRRGDFAFACVSLFALFVYLFYMLHCFMLIMLYLLILFSAETFEDEARSRSKPGTKLFQCALR